MSPGLYSRSSCDVEADIFSAGWGFSMDGEVCPLSSMCRKLEAEKEDEGGGRRRRVGQPRPLWLCCVDARVPGTLNRGPCSGWSPQGVDMFILSILDGVGISTGALIPNVAGHGEWNHLG